MIVIATFRLIMRAVERGEVLDPAKPKRTVLGLDIDIRAHNRAGIGRYFVFFNARPHTAHKGKTPDQAYFTRLPPAAEAA